MHQFLFLTISRCVMQNLGLGFRNNHYRNRSLAKTQRMFCPIFGLCYSLLFVFYSFLLVNLLSQILCLQGKPGKQSQRRLRPPKCQSQNISVSVIFWVTQLKILRGETLFQPGSVVHPNPIKCGLGLWECDQVHVHTCMWEKARLRNMTGLVGTVNDTHTRCCYLCFYLILV